MTQAKSYKKFHLDCCNQQEAIEVVIHEYVNLS
jgi:hypothetical protein